MGIFDNDEAFSNYCKEINTAYWAEEDEHKAGIHPTQIKEKIEKEIYSLGFQYEDITFLDWNIEGPKVKVLTNGSYFGTFNYEENKFEVVSHQKMMNKVVCSNSIYGAMGTPSKVMNLRDFIGYLRYKKSCIITIKFENDSQEDIELYLMPEKQKAIMGGDFKYLKQLEANINKEVKSFEYTGNFSDNSPMYEVVLGGA